MIRIVVLYWNLVETKLNGTLIFTFVIAFIRERNEWIHLDSSKGFNSSEAQVLANKVSDAVGAKRNAYL